FSAVDVSANQLITGLLLEYAVRMGVEAELIALASQTPPTQIRYLNAQEFKALKFAWEPGKFERWQLEPSGQGIAAISSTHDREETMQLLSDQDRGGVSEYETRDGKKRFGLPSEESVRTNEQIKLMGTKVPTSQAKLDRSERSLRVRVGLPNSFEPNE